MIVYSTRPVHRVKLTVLKETGVPQFSHSTLKKRATFGARLKKCKIRLRRYHTRHGIVHRELFIATGYAVVYKPLFVAQYTTDPPPPPPPEVNLLTRRTSAW